MPQSVIRKGVWAALAALAVVALIIAALPLIASTRIVRDRIAFEISAWSGFRVELGAAPRIEVWPSFRAILDDVTLYEWGNADEGPIIRSERIELDLSALDALRGEIGFSKVRLVSPVLSIAPRSEDDVKTAAAAAGGRIAAAIASARQAVSANPNDPDTASLPSGTFGSVEFSDGRIEISYQDGGRESVDAVEGYLSWPEFDDAARLSATATWRGETVTIDASSDQPLILLAGGNAPLTFGLKAKPLNASFSGTANLSESHFVDGKIELASPSLRRTLEWLRTEIAPGSAIGAVSLAAQVNGSGDRFKFAEARLALDEEIGTGGLELSFADPVPSISGTLAFDSINLMSFLSAFAILPIGDDEAPAAIDAALVDQVKLDLRLSAAKATAGAIELSQVAATAQVKDGLMALDISDAAAFSGTLQAGFRLDRQFPGTHGEFRLLASEIDSAALAASAGVKGFAPKGPATISVLLKGDAQDWTSMLDDAEGTISAKFGPGAIAGFDLPAFLKHSSEGGFFALNDVAKGSLTVESAELKASISNGTARIEKAEVKAGPRTIAISGIIPYVGRGLALSGTISPDASENEPNSGVAFFVGGPWSAPFVSPILRGSPVQEW